MFILGHIGVGRRLVFPWIRRLPWLPFAIGALLPDIIDKPLYYARLFPYISCTRTFGHTLLFALSVLMVAWWRRSAVLGTVGLAVVTHIALDCFMDWNGDPSPRGAWIAALWPLLGWRFLDMYMTLSSHLVRLSAAPVLIAEVVGGLLLGWEWWRGYLREDLGKSR